MRGRWRRTASGTALTVALGSLVVLAWQHDGKPFTEVDLNDGGVWVTNEELALTARLNPQIEELDLGVDAGTREFDVIQRATSVYLDDQTSERGVKAVDVAMASAGEATSLPTGAVVAHGGDTFVVVDPRSGKAWVRPESSFSSFSADATEPVASDAVTAAVGTDGRAWVLDRDGGATPFTPDGEEVSSGDTVDLADGDIGRDEKQLQLTVVGEEPVLFAATTTELYVPDADPIPVDAADPTSVRVQEPSDARSVVSIATNDGLYAADLDGGHLERISEGGVNGTPAPPVYLSGAQCVYSAWSDPSSPHNYLRDCADDNDDDPDPIQHMQEGADLRFRVNREVVVLNDVRTGDAWVVQNPGKAKADNWPQVEPKNENKSKLKKTTEEIPDQENRPPEPNDDELGARPGRSTVLPVVALNDHDPDGDIIRIVRQEVMSGPDVEVKIVGGGTQLQVAVKAEDRGVAVIRYYVTDGRVSDKPYATVRLKIIGNGEHTAPRLMDDRKQAQELTVTRRATSSYYLLADFYDKEGDDLTLLDARARGGGVEYRPDGTITFTDTGVVPSVSEIEYTINDGYDDYVGKLKVNVVGETAPPELVPDLSSGVANTQVVVQPLANDRNPEGRELTLKSVRVVGDAAGTEISKDLESGTFTFKATRAKPYYLEYAAYNSSATATAQVRLDIESPPKNNRPPVAVRDKVVVSPGATAQADLLLNDLDPDGDVLVVKRIDRPVGAGVKVSLVDKRLAVVSLTDDLSEPVTVEYLVSDGRSPTTGQLVISQRPNSQANRPPVANKDQVTVRAGSVTTIPVLANDSDPDGGKPRLIQDDLDLEDQDLDIWVAGDSLRLRAPDKPGNYSVVYGERDADGLRASAEVSIFVVEDSARNNHAPLPQPIIDRVITGRPKVISVDLVGADPDGDSVAFHSFLSAPSLGRILDTGVDWIRYEAFEGKAGTDFFQVRVQDKYGATGVAEVRVGVVPEEEVNQPPVALDDTVLVQPNRTIAYDVLTNDVDPDDDPLRIEELNANQKANHENGFVEVRVGNAPEQGSTPINVGYTIEDAAGARDSAILKIVASRDAPFYSPVARDDVAELGDIIGRDPGESVEIPVLDNDLDFDGAKADLHVTGCDAGKGGDCKVVEGDTTVRVELKAQDQVVLYKLDDADKESASTYGVIYVTGTDNVPPQLTTDEDKIPVEATAGEPIVFDLADLVITRAGRQPLIVPDPFPTSIYGSVDNVPGEPTSLEFTPARGRVGPASVSVTVTDGRSLGENGALSSLLTIPIDIKPVGNVAPTMRDAAVDVTAEGDGAEVDLEGLTRDANDDDLASMTYSITSAPDGLDAKIDGEGHTLSIEASGAKVGEVLDVEVAADDGHGGTATAVVSARIVGSDIPVLQIPVLNVAADEGEETTVDLAESAVNRYPDPTIEAKNPLIEGNGKLRGLKAHGSKVSFTPTDTGTSTIKVTVSDASGDASRDVTARINVTVMDVPDAPAQPTLSTVEASSAVLSWVEPSANGAPIKGYEVEGSHGFKQSCPRTTCRLDGLTPGDTYTFTVRAENSEGWGDESPASEEITPNEAPDVMAAPTIVVESKPTGSKMDGQLTLRWTPPHNEGSEILTYEIKEAGSTHVWEADGNQTSHTITGLSNGTSYAFEIRAVNLVEPKREFSGPSRAVAPFGVPLPSGTKPGLTASEADSFNSRAWIKIDWSSWSQPQTNGNAITRYVIHCSGCSSSTFYAQPDETSKQFDESNGIVKGRNFTFTVAAQNDAGVSKDSPSVTGRPWTKAGPVQGLEVAQESPDDGIALIGWNPPADDGGLPIDHYAVQTENGVVHNFGSAPGPGGAPVDFGDNDPHSVRVWAVTSNNGRPVDGQESSLYDIRTWGKPGTPTASPTSSYDWYHISFRVYAGDANGKKVTGVQWSPNGVDGWTDHRSGDTYSAEVGEGGASSTIYVRTVSEASGDRQYSEVIPLSGTSMPKTLTVSFGRNDGCGSLGAGQQCTIYVEGRGFPHSEQPLGVSLAGPAAVDPSKCPVMNPGVKENFDVYVGGSNDCKFTGSGSVTVNASGIFASDSR